MIDFSNASLLAYSHESKFLGDSVFRFGINKNITIQGIINNLLNDNGISGTIDGVKQFISSANDYHPIIINGINFGQGQVTSLSFDEGNWVKFAKYTANIIIGNSGDLYNMDGSYYNGLRSSLTDPNNSPELIDSLDENFSFSVNENKDYTCTHTFSARYNSGISSNPINLAKSLASGFFYNSVPFGFIDKEHSGLYNSSATRYATESYNLIDYTCVLSNTFTLTKESGSYSVQKIYSVQTDNIGISQVTENGTIKGLNLPIYTSAKNGYIIQIAQAFANCTSVFNAYKPIGAASLSSTFIERGATLNLFLGTISYSITYSNDPTVSTVYRWDHTNSIDVSDDGIYTVSEQGEIIGFGKLGSTVKFDNAKIGYGVVNPGILSRCNAVYIDLANPVGTLTLVNKSKTHGVYNGTISYSAEYSDESSFVVNTFISKASVSIESEKPIHIHEVYNIYNNKQIIQEGKQSRSSRNTVNIDLTLKPELDVSIGVVNNCINYCKNILTAIKNRTPGSDKYVSDVQYEIGELSRKFRFSAVVNYFEAKNATDLSLKWP